MKFSSQNTVSALVVLVAFTSALATGCKKDEAPPPLPEAKKVEEAEVVELKVPDAGAEEEEEEKKVGKGGGKPAGALAACCAALRQNAANAPEPTAGHMRTAAAACDVANKSGSKAPFLATLGGLLQGAGAPAACR